MAGADANSEVELVLLERVFLRIGAAETDDQLQSVLAKFLPPVLLKLASQTDGVRKKVMELLVHINKRVKSRPKIQLPVNELLAQYKDPEASPFVTNFTIIYIKMGFPRLETATQVELLPNLVQCLENRPVPQQDSLIQLIIPVLQHVKIPPDPEKSKVLYGLNEKPKVAKLLLDFMMDFLLMPYSPPTVKPPADGTAAANRPPTSATPGTAAAPPGLSDAAYKRVVGDQPTTPDDIEKIKLGILTFLGGSVFPDQDVVCHLVVAMADNRHAVGSAGDRHLKKLVSTVDWNNHAVITKLYSLFQGTVVVKGQTSVVKPDQKRSPGSIQVRIKIFPYLLKSREAPNQFPACVQTVFDCLYGTNTSPRLKIMAVQFVHHLCLHCADSKFNPIGAVLLSGMVKLIGENIKQNVKEDPQLRSLAYVAVGKIARRVPQLVTKDITLLQTFFDAMCNEESDNRLAVQEALSMMSPAFKKLEPANLKLVEALLMENIDKPEPYVRQMVVQYAIAVFPPDHIPSRYMLLLCCGDTKEDVYAEASKALRGGSNKTEDADKKELKLPQFTDMVNYINEKATQRQRTAYKYVIGNNVLAFNPATYVEVLMYLRMCLAHNAGVQPNLESTSTMQTEAPRVGVYVNKLLQEKSGRNVISVYINIIKKLLTAIGGAPAMYCLLEVVAVARSQIASEFNKQLDWIKNFMFSSREDMREHASQFYALIVHNDTTKKQAQVICDLIKNLEVQALEGQHGSLLALGYLIGHIYSSRRRQVGDVTVEDMDVDDAEVNDINDCVLKAIKKIVSLLDNSHMLLSGGACTALGEIGRCGPLPLPNNGSGKKGPSKLSIVETLVSKVHSTKENSKVRDKAALALGYLCLGEEEFPHRRKVIEGLLDCAQPKQIELHFTVGDSLVCASLGVASPTARDPWSVTEEDFQATVGEKTIEVEAVLDLLLTKYIPSPNPHIRQAACIWLMAVIKGCQKQELIQRKLKDSQAAFMSLLSDNDEMTQDFASKGLGIVYEICSKEQKDELVSMLVNTLMTGKRSTDVKVSGDTQVFQDGALGKTPDGKSLSTYKELCSIANDLNQPDLIYKFMHLANHNAMWNSKKGAAFGFSTIAAQASEQLAPYLHQIVPKLYRYQFDPNPRINQAMTSIWSALVTDTKKTVDKYLKEILDDLIVNLTNSQWRVRESSCLALNDVLRGRALDDVVDGLPQLWETLLRVRDDIKESVRKAADVACKTLSRVCIKICDPNYGKVGERATSLVLPCLLKVGLPSQVQEIRALSLATLLKISQNAGALLRPHVPLLVVALLESLSGLEPQYLNYLSLHAASSQVTQEKLDTARLSASKTSPMMQAINQISVVITLIHFALTMHVSQQRLYGNCVQYVDESNLGELVPRLTDLIRSGVGLGTKAGCATFIGSLVLHCPQDLSPYAGKLLGSLLNGLSDRNATVKKSYALTIGYLVKVAKDSSVEKLVLRLKEWYLEKEDESVRHACGLTFQYMGQKSPDVLKRHAALAMPIAFLAMHQKKEIDEDGGSTLDSSAVWEEVWLECTPGTEGGIRLYLPELVAISKVALQSQSWPMKAQGASAMRKISDKLGTNLGPPHLGMVLSALLEGLPGRTWTGKEELLKAISAICVNCKSCMVESPPADQQPTVEAVVEAVMKECKKDNVAYKQEAVAAAGAILEACEVDRFSEINAILKPLLSRSTKDTEDLDVNKDALLAFQAVGFDCIGQAWPKTKNTQETYRLEVCKLLGASLNTSVWKVEIAKLRTCTKVLSRLVILENESTVRANRSNIQALLQHLTDPLCQALANVKYTAIRTEALGVTEVLVNKLSECDQLDIFGVKEAYRLQETLTAMTSDNQPELADRAATLLKTITAATGSSV